MLAVGIIVLGVLAVPHVLRFEGVAPTTAAAMWMSDLIVRALLCVYGALFVVFYLPGTELYALISHWCWHGVVPLLATHLQFTGHNLGDAAVVGPAVVLAVSLAWGGLGIFRAARAVRRLLKAFAIGAGPGESLVLGDGQVMIAAAGLRRPQIVVSAGALIALDDEELAAGLDHERGHIDHRHRFALLAAEVFGAVARFLPGTRHAQAELLFHLERDADQFALARNHHPASLASAICKAAESTFAIGSPSLALGGSSVVRRVNVLLDGPGKQRYATAMVIGCALLLTTFAIIALLALPGVAHASVHAAGSALPAHPCPD